ncbi:hypothetical protein B0O99DRAFT_503642 [Bisporella sp. PMI_857]|nr:hypothetical protein B0O99DRAFT_503642 [Bisporella sp. PMI_857]
MSYPRSMESVLDQEAKEVLALLEGNPANGPRGSASSAGSERRSSSPLSPQSPVRSMLDVGDSPSPPRAPSITGSDNGVSSGQHGTKIRSMLDIGGPSSSAASTRSAQTSPTLSTHKLASVSKHPRSASDAAARPPEFGERAPGYEKPSPFQFSGPGFLPANPGGPVVPKRNTQGPSLMGKKLPSAMSEVMKGGDISAFGARDRGRHHSLADIESTAKSRSPHGRLGLRSNSPHTGSGQDTSKFTLKDGRILDMSNAYRRLSDGNLALAGGSLSTLSERKWAGSGDVLEGVDSRLQKSYTPMEGEDVIVDSSDDGNTSDESHGRGRRGKSSEGKAAEKSVGTGRTKGQRTARSLMAAAEEERLEVASRQLQDYKVRSMLDPDTPPSEASASKTKSSKSSVHPHTSFDDMGFMTPVTSDTEAELKDVNGAQRLAIRTTVVSSTPATKRCVRSIYRGDFNRMQLEADEGYRRVRKYLVATDLSEEAQHAMEWTIGTVLRDGDTLLAIYCMDEEVITTPDPAGEDKQLVAQASAVAASTVATVSTPKLRPVAEPSPLSSAFNLGSGSRTPTASPMGRGFKQDEHTRMKATDTITDMVTRLLRKTKLQVKVVVEVLHCKSPKHLITEIIDYLSPTLVVLGSRGRSALKGVILGSFSNYLVNKSSAPVMVARKKLSKQASRKYRRPNVRQANNLAHPSTMRTLADAVIEKPRAEKKGGRNF